MNHSFAKARIIEDLASELGLGKLRTVGKVDDKERG